MRSNRFIAVHQYACLSVVSSSIWRVQSVSVSNDHRDARHGLKAALCHLRTLIPCVLLFSQRKFSFVTSLKDFAQYFDCLDDVAFISKGPHEYYKVCFFTSRLYLKSAMEQRRFRWPWLFEFHVTVWDCDNIPYRMSTTKIASVPNEPLYTAACDRRAIELLRRE